jgi:hypothetical protein
MTHNTTQDQGIFVHIFDSNGNETRTSQSAIANQNAVKRSELWKKQLVGKCWIDQDIYESQEEYCTTTKNQIELKNITLES